MTRGDDVVAKLLHTADWHLGKRFPMFDKDGDRDRLARARLEVVDAILAVASRNSVDAILCAGDLFDDPNPDRPWWEGLAARLRRGDSNRPIFLLPGNHDPLRHDSVYDPAHPFRGLLPPFVHVVDRKDFTFEIRPDLVLYAVPCVSTAGQAEVSEGFPDREPGDERLRIGLAHGSTFERPGVQRNFAVARDAAVRRGLDYLALGDTHAFQDVYPEAAVPTVYPGTPETTNFGERDTGNVAVVLLPHHGRRALVRQERVGTFLWRDEICLDLAALRRVRDSASPKDILRLHLDMAVILPERDEVELILEELRGTEAIYPRVAILVSDTENLRIITGSEGDGFPPTLPAALRTTVDLLQAKAQGPDGTKAARALYHLWKLVHGRSA